MEKEQIDKGIIQGIREYREKYPAAPELAGRVPRPRYHYYGKDVWEAAAAKIPYSLFPSCQIRSVPV